MGRTFQSGIISRLVIGGGTYAVLHNETQIDVDNSNGLPTIIKLQPIDPSLGQCTVYINDYGNNSSVGNITIVASGGNLINGQPTLVLDTDGIGAEISVSDQKSFIASLNNDSQGGGGGTITGANNGLTIFGTDVQLGGNLIMPTNIQSSGSNTFSITDDIGILIKSRDANANFILNSIYGIPTFINSSLIFTYSSDGGTIFTDSVIIYNFGGANNFTQTVDVFSFGDYHTFNSVYQSFNLGRNNNISSSSNLHVLGDFNTLDSCYGVKVFGNNNSISYKTDKVFIGNNDKNLIIDGVTGGLNARWLQIGNGGLVTGDFYIDSAANIFANGDMVTGWKV